MKKVDERELGGSKLWQTGRQVLEKLQGIELDMVASICKVRSHWKTGSGLIVRPLLLLQAAAPCCPCCYCRHSSRRAGGPRLVHTSALQPGEGEKASCWRRTPGVHACNAGAG